MTPPKNAAAPREVVAAWRRIEIWLEAHAPAIHRKLAKPASERALASAEKAMGLELPEGLRQLYGLHDGLENKTMGLFEGWTWLPIREVVSQWQDWKELLEENREAWEEEMDPEVADRGVRADNWNTGWIPITYSGSGDHHCVDLAPAKGGTPGQIIRMWHDMPERKLDAKSLAEWLEALAGRLEAGELAWSEDNERIEEASARPARSRPARRRSDAEASSREKPEGKPASKKRGGAASGSPLQWTFATGGEIKSSPSVGSDGTIYVGSADNNLYAIKPDGTKGWAFATDGEVRSSPVIGGDGAIYVGSDDGNLYAVTPQGTKKWAFPTGNSVSCRPVLTREGLIYITLSSGGLSAVTPQGNKKWEAQAGDCGPAIGGDGTVYVAGSDEDGNPHLRAISFAGKQKWAFPLGGYVAAAPVVGGDGTIYIGAFDNNLYAVTPDGAQKWAFGTGDSVAAAPAIGSDGTLYVGSYDKHLYALTPDGQKRWAFKVGGMVWVAPTIGRDGTIYVSSRGKNLYAITPDGKKKWVFASGGPEWSSPCAVGGDDVIYAGNSDGKLYAVGS